MRRRDGSVFQAWVWDEIVLCLLLTGAITLFVGLDDVRSVYFAPEANLALNTAVALVAALAAALTGTRYSVDGRSLDLLLACGFGTAAATLLAFDIAPLLDGGGHGRAETWAALGGRCIAASFLAGAPFVRGHVKPQRRGVALVAAAGFALLALWLVARLLGNELPAPATSPDIGNPLLMTVGLAVQAQLSLLAVVGFGYRLRLYGLDFDRWLALASTITLFAQLHYVFTPVFSGSHLSQGDFLTLLAYAVLLAGVWRAIRAAELGRAVAEERARVAREIHDGLAQYLFAISTQASLLEHGADEAKVVPRLKEAAAAAQQEARFAVLALSSAAGTAPFDAALRRYVDFLTADGELEVELDLDPALRLGPDEQIEVFRIVQEGLANVRRHAGARRADVTIGERGGRRIVRIRDDGRGFEDGHRNGGQGLRNIETRAEAIGGRFRIASARGSGTSLEVTLRA